MNGLTIYPNSSAKFTLVPNQFIDEFMKDANDAQIKIYLYLLRVQDAPITLSISDLAEKFNHTEKDVLRALEYWSARQVLSLEYVNNTLAGIRLLDFQQPPTVAVTYLPKQDEIAPETVSVTAPPSPPATPVVVKKTLEELKTLKNDPDFAQILFIAEQYLQKTLSPTEIQMFSFLYADLTFSLDLMDYLIQYCISRGKTSSHYMQKVAISWHSQKITTPKEAQSISHKYEKHVYTIMRTLGKYNNHPTDIEFSYIDKWMNQYCFEMEVIIEACDRTVLAVENNRFNYADAMLTAWHKASVHHVTDIATCDSKREFQTKKKATSSNNKFNQFTQRTYDFDALEKEILSN